MPWRSGRCRSWRVPGAMLWRGVFGVVTCCGDDGQARRRRMAPGHAGALGHGAGRSVLSSFVSVTWYVSWESMSLADTYAVGFTAPLIMTVLAVPMLGERIRWRRALSTLVGFGGVLIMLRPGGDLWTPVVVLLLAGTVVMSVTRIMTRQLTTTETPECQAFWLLICHTLTGLLMLPLPGAWSDRADRVAGAGLPRAVERAGALRICTWLCPGAGVRAGAHTNTRCCPGAWRQGSSCLAICRPGIRCWAPWWWQRRAPTMSTASGCAGRKSVRRHRNGPMAGPER